MSFWEYLDLDEQTKKALRIKDKEVKNKKIILIFSIIIIILITYKLKVNNLLSQNTFELIFSAFIGGFIGSSNSFILIGNK